MNTARTPIAPTDPADATGTTPEGHLWREAGSAWGRRAADWACLFEHYAVDVIHAAYERLGVRAGTRILDIACGAGLAVRMADACGARTAGIDASGALIEIARARTPAADLRVGTMFDLPWDDGSFDAVVSINGVWGGCEAALVQAYRVLRPGGTIAISFWGQGPLDLRPVFRVFAAAAPPAHRAGMRRTNAIGQDGAAEEMLEAAGFSDLHRDGRLATIEWPDEDTAWRALASAGPAAPALDAIGTERLRVEVLDALRDHRGRDGVFRLRNDHQFVIGRKPSEP